MTQKLKMKQLYRFLLPAFLALITAVPPSFAEQKEWRIDNVHSYVGFKVRHMMVSWVRG